MFDHLHMRIESLHRFAGTRSLRKPDACGGVDDLALQVGKAHGVMIDDADSADAGRGEIVEQRRTETARANHQHACVLQLVLPRATHFVQHEMPRITFDFIGRQCHQCCPEDPKPPVPRAVSSSTLTSVQETCVTGAMTICAMRSPRVMKKSSWP